MNGTSWLLIDTKTAGLSEPFVVELAAQRMCGWGPDGEPFCKLLNQGADVPEEASCVHEYTREILERDGEPPVQVYREFSDYAGRRPLVSFNLEHDLDVVLKPEWKRLRIPPIGGVGFCALRLAKRLLDPIPAGNCKLQTLRQFYRLPDRCANTALGDVQTISDFFGNVLRPIAERRGLDTWEKLATYAAEEWYPSRISFGKHKGRLFNEARRDAELRRWLEWLVGSSNARSAGMGRWYMKQLDNAEEPQSEIAVFATAEEEEKDAGKAGTSAGDVGAPTKGAVVFEAVVIYSNPELEKLRQLVAGARARLAELEVNYAKEKSRLDAVQATLFRLLREHYQNRDRLRLIVDYRKKYFDSLIRGGDEEAKQAENNYKRAKAESDKDYEETAAAVAEKRQLTGEEEADLTSLWKKLVKLYHPDRFAHEPDKLETYEKLTAAINRAKDCGDIETLRQIADDPHGFILRQGWASLDLSEEIELTQLRRLYEALQIQIIEVIESLSQLRESAEYELCQISEKKPGVLDELAAERAKVLEKESAELQREAERLAGEIEELAGEAPTGIR